MRPRERGQGDTRSDLGPRIRGDKCSLVEAKEQSCAPCAGDRRRTVDDPAVRAGPTTLEYRDIMVPEPFQRTREPLLFVQSTLGVYHLNPLCRGPAIRRHEACLNVIAMKLPAGILVDTLKPDVNAVATGDVSKCADEVADIFDQ